MSGEGWRRKREGRLEFPIRGVPGSRSSCSLGEQVGSCADAFPVLWDGEDDGTNRGSSIVPAHNGPPSPHRPITGSSAAPGSCAQGPQSSPCGNKSSVSSGQCHLPGDTNVTLAHHCTLDHCPNPHLVLRGRHTAPHTPSHVSAGPRFPAPEADGARAP